MLIPSSEAIFANSRTKILSEDFKTVLVKSTKGLSSSIFCRRGNVFSLTSNSTSLTINDYTKFMLNEGSVALPYQPYEGKTIHEKDLGDYTNIYNVSQLYKHDYNLENQVGDTIHVTCWSTKTDKIPLIDITRYAFSNIQVYNSSSEETIQVIKWGSSGFRFINDAGNIDGNSYTVIHYYINGEPTTY